MTYKKLAIDTPHCLLATNNTNTSHAKVNQSLHIWTANVVTEMIVQKYHFVTKLQISQQKKKLSQFSWSYFQTTIEKNNTKIS